MPPNICPLCGLPNVSVRALRDDKMERYSCNRCGEYLASGTAVAVLPTLGESERARIVVEARRASAAGSPLELTSYKVDELKERGRPSVSLFQSVDDVLLYLADRASRHFEVITFHPSHDYPLLGHASEAGMQDALNAARDLGYLDQRGTSITVDGWRRVEELQRLQPESRKAFVAMWFASEMNDAWERGFKPGIEDTGYFRPVQMLEIEHNERIDDRIIAEIRSSGLLVADFTGHRGSVYFEAGFAMGLGIPVIWTCREDEVDGLQFDTRQYNHVLWDTPESLRARLSQRILAVVPAATRS